MPRTSIRTNERTDWKRLNILRIRIKDKDIKYCSQNEPCVIQVLNVFEELEVVCFDPIKSFPKGDPNTSEWINKYNMALLCYKQAHQYNV